ncbi:MerR family transcriptional regulator [Novosphingobium sp. Gsoil 351]|uniref:MerR family transcriptional regulator n=1 Tax=Novosphingobium sp. Gsoil 351 TaxID=2675225 RepID=UPI0012B4FEF3|nr:MerR family transcriptional regulator [Novosphingobium sp. Gsoil 351]QGN55991.1 MerR family transcriptional regulator [Novosphingobium sp. Gsoil 351]
MSEQTPFPFADGKDPEAFRTIGEVAQVLGVKQHVLRYWEEQFPMLKPLTRAGGRRYYRPSDVALIAEIDRLLHHEGFTIRGARQALSGKGAKVAPASVAQGSGEEPAQSGGGPLAVDTAARLRSVRDELSRALQNG